MSSGFYDRLLTLNFQLQDAMSEHEGQERDTLASSVAILDTLVGPAAQNCWASRPGTGSGWQTFSIYWASEYTGGTSCGELDHLTAQTLRGIANNIRAFEPGLAEVAMSLAVEADGATERLDEIVPDTPGEIWGNTDSTFKTGVYLVGALLLWRAIK